MGILKKQLVAANAKNNIRTPGTAEDTMSVPTGFDFIDYACATVCETEEGEEFINAGLPYGKAYMFIGNSQAGKTTLAIQCANTLAAPYNGDVLVLDYERSGNNLGQRVRHITGASKEEFEDRFTVYNHVTMSTEFLKEVIFQIRDMKKKLKASDMVEHIDIHGNTVKMYPPTILIVDSVPAMKPKEVLEDSELDNNMVGGKMAAANSNLAKTIVALLEAYNITIFFINHITTKIVTNAYAPKKIQLPGLGDSDNIPGGGGLIYLCSYVFRLSSGKELKSDKDFTEGRMTEFRILKSRSSFNNTRTPVVLHSREGFSNVLTNMTIAKENGVIKGSGQKYYIASLPDVTFSLKKFYHLYTNEAGFQVAFDAEMEEFYTAQITAKHADIASSSEENGGFEDDYED